MNINQVNVTRAAIGLDPIARNEAKAIKAKRTIQNRLMRGQESRELKAKRNSGRK